MRTAINHTTKILLGLFGVFLSTAGFAASAPLDPTFGNGGNVITPFNFPPYHFSSNARDIAVQPDGKIVIVGTLRFVQPHILLARYNADGSLDATFGNAGETSVGFLEGQAHASGVAVQPDGRIVVVGSLSRPTHPAHEFLVLRFGPNGAYDTSFGAGGVVRINIGSGNYWRQDVAVQPDGKIMIAGESIDGPALLRLNFNGSLDTSFDGDGKVLLPGSASGIVLQQDGKVIVAGTTGTHSMLTRFNSDGSPDLSFDDDGTVLTSVGSAWGGDYYDAAVQPDGKIVALGISSDTEEDEYGYAFASLVRYHPTGALDESFDDDGIARVYVWGQFYAMAIRPNGQIVTAGGSTFGGIGASYLGRFSANGSLEGVSTYVFGHASYFSALALQPDGKIVAGGGSLAGQYSTATDLLVARFLPDVIVSGRVTTPTGFGLRNAVVVLTDAQGNARSVVTSSFGNYLFEGVVQGQELILSVRAKRYRFTPLVVSITSDLTGLDLVGQE